MPELNPNPRAGPRQEGLEWGEVRSALQVQCPAPTSASFHHRNTLLHVFEKESRKAEARGRGGHTQEPTEGRSACPVEKWHSQQCQMCCVGGSH